MGCVIIGVIFGSFLGDNCLRVIFWGSLWAIFFGGSFLGGSFLGVIFKVFIFGVIFGSLLGVIFGWSFSGCHLWVFFWLVNFGSKFF